MRSWYSSVFLEHRFFSIAFSIAGLFCLSYFIPNVYAVAKIIFFLFLALLCTDYLLLFGAKNRVEATRNVPEKLSNGDENTIGITIANGYAFKTYLRCVDEVPHQFQKRDFNIEAILTSGTEKTFSYTLRPVERGVYQFGKLHVFVQSGLRLFSRRYSFGLQQQVPVYPSYLQLKKYDLMAFTSRLHEFGLKKIRRIGHTIEFEQIKEYIPGDDIRKINWKATAKKSSLMVNQFQDEKSQPVYSIIDKGRVMKMPFHHLSLLDYAINATLVISSTALKKQDKAGMFTFSNRVENRVVAQRRSSQMQRIMETLYNVKTNYAESDFGRLYVDIKRNIPQRSLLLLYTNFETLDALHRQLGYLQSISRHHLLVVIFFVNTELDTLLHVKARNTLQVFEKTIAEKFIYEKKLIVNQLKKYGIQTILTTPEDLTINTINKYMEIKARGLL